MIRSVLPVLSWIVLVPSIPALAQEWTEFGGSASEGGVSKTPTVNSSRPVVELDSSGFPIVAWLEGTTTTNSTTRQALLRRWNGESWTNMAGVANGTDTVASGSDLKEPSLALLPGGAPALAWVQKVSTKSRLYFRYWNGQAWAPMGASDTGDGVSGGTTVNAYSPSLGIDPSGRPVIAWAASGTGIHLRRWNNSSGTWEEIGGSATGNGIRQAWAGGQVRVAFDGEGHPMVSWTDYEGSLLNEQVYLRKWDPSRNLWVGLGGSDTGAGLSAEPWGIHSQSNDLASSPAGAPCLIWSAIPAAGPTPIKFRTWNGQAWVGPDGTQATNPIEPGTDAAYGASLRMNSSGRPIIAWGHGSYATGWWEIYLQVWNGQAWEEIGVSATGGGISGTAEASMHPWLATNGSGDLSVTWAEDVFSNQKKEVYLKGIFNTAPDPTAPTQLRLDGATPIPTGGLTQGETGIVVQVDATDPQGELFAVEVELRALGVPTTEPPTVTASAGGFSGPTASLPVSGLSLGTAYTWRARTVDESGKTSGWTDFQTADPWTADFLCRDNAAPSGTPGVLLHGDDGSPVPTGSTMFTTERVVLPAVVDDPEGDPVRLEAEIRPVGLPFQDVPTATGTTVPSGGTASVTIPLLQNGSFRIQYRFRDGYDLPGPWISYGGNGESEADLVVVSLGSVGGRFRCGQSAGGEEGRSLPPALLAGLFALAAAIRRGPA